MVSKIVTVLLIAAIVVSIFSLVVTLGLNVDEFSRTRTITVIRGADAKVGTVGLTIDPTPSNSNG